MKHDIPRNESAPVLRIFGDHAGRMAGLVRTCPALLLRISLAPPRAVHAIGAFLHHAPDASLPDADVAVILATTAPRVLLQRAFPEAPARLYRLLDHCGDWVQDAAFYRRLVALCCGPLAKDVFASRMIHEQCLTAFESWLQFDRAVWPLCGALDGVQRRGEAVDVMIRFLRAYGTLTEADLTLPQGAGLPAIYRRLQAALDRIRLPAPPFRLLPPWRLVTTIGELRLAGRRMRNCLDRPNEVWFRLIDGSGLIILGEDPHVIAELRHVGGNHWLLEDVRGPDNGFVPSATKAVLLDALRKAGAKLLTEHPEQALSRLVRELNPGRHDDLDEQMEVWQADLNAMFAEECGESA